MNVTSLQMKVAIQMVMKTMVIILLLAKQKMLFVTFTVFQGKVLNEKCATLKLEVWTETFKYFLRN